MGKIYKGQTELQIKLVMNTSLSSAASQFIKYKKPSGATGYWQAVVATIADGTVYYNVDSSNDINESGTWRFWGAFRNTDSDYAPGEAVKVVVYDEGD